MEYKLLKNIAQITMGQSPDSSSYNEEEKGLPFYQGNADFGELYPTARVWCDAPKKIASEGDILISVRAPIGALNYASEDCCIGRGLAAITIKNEAEKNYVYHLLKARKTDLNSKGTGSTFKAIGKSVLEEVQVPVISREQQEISMQLMDTIENVIRQRKKELRLLDELVKARFVEMFGDPIQNPKGYPVHQLSEYITSLTSGSRGWAQYCVDDGEEWFITIKNVKDCHISTDNMQPVNAPDNAEAKRTKVQEGDLLISITADLGRTGVVTKEIAGHGAYINQHLSCIRINRDVLNPVFVAHYMESPAGKEQFVAKNQSAVKAGLNFNSINSLKLMVPPLAEQNRFIDFIAQVDKSKFDGMAWQRWLFSVGMKSANRNNPCGTEKQDRDASGWWK